ncbi:phage tail sheath subtilisin-like domain-containing protein [Oryzomicrobium sp.]|uniref:phage tail sheath subtilisin-like domain-containing protein n=1 Tax=Oryzomicrobium sp. TaxID=1911578 RepID=UPI002FE1E4BA
MASANIAFDQIQASTRKPGKYFEFNTKLAVRTLPGNLQRVLVVGQKTAAGILPALSPVDVFSDAEAALYAGRGSIAHLQVRAAIRANPYLQMTLILLNDDAASLAATGTVAISNPASGPGTLTLAIGNDYVTIAMATGDSTTSIATGLAAAINAKADLPVTAAASQATVTLTAKNKGTLGNYILLSTAGTGQTGVVATLTAMSGGATDPALAPALAAMFGAGHNVINVPYIDATSLTALRTHLTSVSGPMEQRGAFAALGHTGTLAQAITLAAALDDGRQSLALLPKSASLPWEVGAAYAAVCAGEEDPARPLNTLELTGIAPPPLASRLGRTEQENCLYNGVTPLEVGPGERVQIVRAITTYTTDPQGIADISLLDLTTIRTLDYARTAYRTRIALRFPREKLSERTPPKVRDQLLDVSYKLEELEILENVDANKDGHIVERDLQDPNRLDARIPTDVVNGLHVFAARIDLLL